MVYGKDEMKFGKEFLPEVLNWLVEYYGLTEDTLPYSTEEDCLDFGREFLQDILDWVASNIDVDTVFPEDVLIDWYEVEFGGL